MNAPATYLHWGFVLISVPNLLLLIGMIVVFALALLAPFPHGDVVDEAPPPAAPDARGEARRG
ncbi:MAG: hypothetical protein M0Z49_08215 [Chloroflexi bacterium]|nr:hypothetical protein [Chloroflexota bacterium]